MKQKNNRGFSLIELLIVVTIIGIIAAIAIPNILASRRAANEGSAQQSLRTIASCEMTYLFTDGAGSYTDLAGLGAKTLTDSVLASGSKSGYTFVATTQAGSPPLYWVYAIPTTTSGFAKTGTRRFAISEDGILRSDATLTPPADEAEVRLMNPSGN